MEHKDRKNWGMVIENTWKYPEDKGNGTKQEEENSMDLSWFTLELCFSKGEKL